MEGHSQWVETIISYSFLKKNNFPFRGIVMLIKTVFMLKPLEARSRKTFSDAAGGGLVIEKVFYFLFICFLISYHSNLRNTLFNQKFPIQSSNVFGCLISYTFLIMFEEKNKV